MSSQHFRLHRSVPVVAALTLAFALGSPPVSTAAPGAPAPEELLLNTTARHASVEPKPGAVATARFRVEVPHAGLLALDLTIPRGTQQEPALRLLAPYLADSDRVAGALRRIHQTPTTLLVEAQRAATVIVEVTSLDPGQSLPAFKLRSAFQNAGGLLIAKDVDPWDDDLGGKKPPVPGSAIIGGELCALGEQDDHGDVPFCATAIVGTQTVAGVLHNDAGDDEDVFLLRLPGTAVLKVEAVTDAAVQLVLRSSDGLVVAVLRSEGAGVPMRLARALAAGSYFLEVESLNGDDAVYALSLLRSSRP